jgi:endonuclease/exonuclease/phosphatase family metal-dependent hydrolase
MTRRTSRIVLRAAISVVVAVPLTAPVAASAAPRPARQLTVLQQNLYLGADLAPAITATTPEAFVAAVAQIYGTVLFTSFPTRAAAIAAEVAANHPDLIGLEEVSRWTVTGPSPAPSLDYLAILQAQLSARGLNYAVAAVSDNADIGPLPLAVPCGGPVGACTVEFEDRDVVLVNTDTDGLTVGNPRSGHYATQEVIATPVGSLSFDRGWATVDGSFWGQRFRFAVTHLETEDFPAVQEAQGQEFLQVAKAPGAVLAVGDFNSAADGSNTATYAGLTADYFRDAWSASTSAAGLSCCQDGLLVNPVSGLHERIDLVLTHALHPMSASLVGDAVFEAVPPLWPSDHAGIVATLRLH